MRFFGVLKKFNESLPLDIKFRKNIEEYFNYRWSYHKNQAFEGDLDDQLPEFVKLNMLKNFMFFETLNTFNALF